MKLNTKQREMVEAELGPGESIVASVELRANLSNNASRAGSGLKRRARLLAKYGIGDEQLLMRDGWATLTNQRVLFHHVTRIVGIKPTDLVAAHPADQVHLRWSDGTKTGAMKWRELAFVLPDNNWIISHTPLCWVLLSKHRTAEPNLLLEGFGDRAGEQPG